MYWSWNEQPFKEAQFHVAEHIHLCLMQLMMLKTQNNIIFKAISMIAILSFPYVYSRAII